MVQKKLWLLNVIVAALSLLRLSLSAESVVQGRVGGFAELGCSLTPPSEGATTPNLFPLHVVEWVRLGYNVPILIKFGSYTPRVHPNYRGRVSLSHGASLLVDKLTLEDEGWFECRILLLDRTTDEFQNGTWNFLSISAPPVFIKTPPPFLEVMLGESLTLRCDAHGNPKPTIIWRKDGSDAEKQKAIQVLNETLSLSKVTRETAGIYKCHVSNSEGNLTHTTQLQVKGPPIIVMPPEDTTMNMSQDAILQCQAEAYPSNLTILKSRVKILVDGTLLISGLIPEDSGNYTCTPTNGLMTPPSASAYLKVKHPARVVRMPRETYLPMGMGGKIICPVQAEPPVLYVNWTKNGASLDLEQYPGWMVNSEGSVFITAANDDAVGMYTCTAYNSYGTMGQSEPTKVILKDPPSFRVSPRAEYLQEVGRELVIPCQSQGDPTPNITWNKVGPAPRSPFTVLSNGSLVLRPLSKDHQGAWECLASNRVATVSASTTILVLGTSPHAVTSVSVDPGITHANVSWEPGFDGGYTQTFTVWVKPTVRGKHEWASIPVPTSKTSLLVTGLQAVTSYQFSVLAQNKLGSGPFTPPTEAPTMVTTIAVLSPPTLLSANRTSLGVLLQWVPPLEESPPLTSFVLQAKRGKGEWVTIDREIAVNVTELIVQGLVKDSNYELRLLSCRDRLFSVPSDSVVISTEDIPSAFQKSSSPQAHSPSDSPDNRSSFDKGSRSEYQDQRKQLLSSSSPPPHYTQFESHFGGSPSPTSAIESISRSPDGRFVIQPDIENSTPTHIKKNLKKEFPQSPGRGSGGGSNNGSFKEPNQPNPGCSEALLERASFYSDCSEKRASDSLKKYRSASHREDIFPSLTRRARALERERLPHQARYQPISGDSQLTEPSTMITQLDGERERDNLSKCLKLVKEREQMERELEHYTASRRAQAHDQEQRRAKSASPLRKWTGVESEDPIWKPQDIHLRQKSRPSSLAKRVSDYRRGCYFGNTSSPMERLPSLSSTYIQWDISPVTSPTSQVPVQSLDIPSHSRTNLSGARARHPQSHLEEEEELTNSTLVGEGWLQERKIKKEALAFRSTTPARFSPPPSELHHVVAGEDRDTGPNLHYFNPRIQSVIDMEEVRVVQKNTLSRNPSGCSTLPYDHQKAGAKGKVIVSDDSSSILPYSEQEKEGIRARSRKSDKCAFGESPSRISPLTLLENEAESDQSNFSRMSESMKVKLAPQPARMSPLQTSTILEYLSLPGFIEMSVDDPVEVTESSESVEPSVEGKTGTLLGDEPDVVPKSWEKHGQEHSETNISPHNGAVHDHSTLNIPVEHDQPGSIQASEPCSQLEARDTCDKSDIRLKSYSLVRTPARCYPMSGPSWRGTVPFQPPKNYSLERRQHIERADMQPPYHTPGPSVPDPPQHMESSLSSRRGSDPRRQGAVFPDSSRWPLSYQDTLRSVQHKYVPQNPSRHFGPTRPVARVDYMHPAEPRRGPPRPFLPRGYSWPSPYHTSFPQREQDIPRQVDKGMGAARGFTETEGRDIRGDGGRASYASQSSGRGSVGPYGHGHLRQSLSITPTLLSSPETTKESEMHRADKDVREQRSKRRNTSVDESYEWDAVECSVDPDILEAMKMERTHAGFGRGREFRQDRPRSTAGLQDFQSKRLYSISPPLVSQPPQHRYSRSLSEARFNALRQEFQEYRRAQQSCSQDSCIPPDPDSDSSSALL
ncbi:hypothetical protein cypCar_00000138 [Cyprinus carpio]|nr:hypothetical protein cypCar_00000138 [Cyprinus carpio]